MVRHGQSRPSRQSFRWPRVFRSQGRVKRQNFPNKVEQDPFGRDGNSGRSHLVPVKARSVNGSDEQTLEALESQAFGGSRGVQRPSGRSSDRRTRVGSGSRQMEECSSTTRCGPLCPLPSHPLSAGVANHSIHQGCSDDEASLWRAALRGSVQKPEPGCPLLLPRVLEGALCALRQSNARALEAEVTVEAYRNKQLPSRITNSLSSVSLRMALADTQLPKAS